MVLNIETPLDMPIPRRDFLKKSISASALLAFPAILSGNAASTRTVKKVRIGLVGVGGQGLDNALQLMALPDVQIVAIADPAPYWNLHDYYYRSLAGREPVRAVIEEHYRRKDPAFKLNVYVRFEEMLEKEKELDAIVCSTPDHTHFYVSATALKAGKHVFCEKPLTHNVWEARELQRIARESGLATQMGNRGHSESGIRRTVELLRSGLLGEVREAHSWAHATRWNQGLTTGLPPPTEVPTGMDWDTWLGPRDFTPYSDAYCPVRWRDFWQFGTGALGDFGCHDMDAAVWAFDLQSPESVQIHPGGFPVQQWEPGIAPYSEIGTFQFPARGDRPSLKLNWYSGGLRPAHHESMPSAFQMGERGELFVGTRGVIQTDGAGSTPRVFPRELRLEAEAIPRSIPRSNGHFRDWIDAIHTGTRCSGDFEYSARLTEIVLLGVLSLRLGGRTVHWDHGKMEAKGIPEAQAFIREPIRAGWTV
jgi:predicted dehydrogenase